ncbi:ATP-binding protein [Pseudooceanicola endophyticus]|uniref:ATP-binding protein n=1 Tax=Pseudooceanicola endophyticus TaxID=2841273 RepID=UPI0022A7DBAD|nr:ATP-binding protein [Pseudooceanicola endophyticus]
MATGAVWLSAVVWIDYSTRAKVEAVLDARLEEAARMVSSLLSDHRIAVAGPGSLPATLHALPGDTVTRQLSCQIWSLSGTLVGRSGGAPRDSLAATAQEGFSRSVVDGEGWRVYALTNEALGLRVMVGDSLAVRDRLVRDVIEGLLVPAAVILPLLALLIWISVARGLAPLDRLTRELHDRAPSDLSPLAAGPAAREIRPVRAALDRLLARVAAAREAERDFTTYAAHELKTPLAGLRTQAQVVRLAPDAETRASAIRAIETSVDRTDRMVRQLLELAEVDRAVPHPEPCDLRALLHQVAEDLGPLARSRDVAFRIAPGPEARCDTTPFLLGAALRNVAENAVLASSPGGAVLLSVWQARGLEVRDQGPGLPEALRPRVTERFTRGPTSAPQGSGLGLSITASAMERLGGRVSFADAPGGGLIVRLDLGPLA